MRLWDKSIKNKVSIREYLPKENDGFGLFSLIVPTLITVVTIIFFMVTYLP